MLRIIRSFREVNVGPLERAFSIGAGMGLVLFSFTPKSWLRRLAWAMAGDLLLRGITGHSVLFQMLDRRKEQARDYRRGTRVSETIRVRRSPEYLYSIWRDLENLPMIMRHLESVKTIDHRRSHWTARGPAGTRIEWDAEIVRDLPNRLISWQSLENAAVIHSGSVSFERMVDGSTEIRVVLRYELPGGVLGATLALILGQDPGHQIREDLLEFQRTVEAGKVLSAAR